MLSSCDLFINISTIKVIFTKKLSSFSNMIIASKSKHPASKSKLGILKDAKNIILHCCICKLLGGKEMCEYWMGSSSRSEHY